MQTQVLLLLLLLLLLLSIQLTCIHRTSGSHGAPACAAAASLGCGTPRHACTQHSVPKQLQPVVASRLPLY
jgi:hypothetical protein